MSKLLNLQISTTTSQEVAPQELTALGNVVRKYCISNACNIPTFSYTNGSTSVTLNQSGYYKIVVNATFSSETPGTGTLIMYANGIPVTHATASETITTANTEYRSMSFTTTIRVLPNAPVTIALVNNSEISLILDPVTVSIVKIC